MRSERMLCERKSFNFLLKENPRGRFLRIVEEAGRFNASIIIPLSGLKEFQKLLAEMTQATNNLASKKPAKTEPVSNGGARHEFKLR